VRTTSSLTLFRTEAAVASLLAGGLLIAGHLLNYGAGEYGTVFGTGLVLAAHVALVFSFVGVHAAQSSRAGLLGRVGTVLAMAGSVFVAAVVFVELAGAAGSDVAPVLASEATATRGAVGPLGFVVGMLAFAVATVRAGVFPAAAGSLLVAGTVVFTVGTLAGTLADPITVVGAVLTGLGCLRLGIALVRPSVDLVDPEPIPSPAR
jgi:hypothetical protein